MALKTIKTVTVILVMVFMTYMPPSGVMVMWKNCEFLPAQR